VIKRDQNQEKFHKEALKSLYQPSVIDLEVLFMDQYTPFIDP